MKHSGKLKRYRPMWTTLSIIGVLLIIGLIFINCSSFGKIPKGERLERVKISPNYRDGRFQNIHETKQLTSDKGTFGMMWKFLFKSKDRLRPETELPVIKTDLWQLDRNENLLVWFGHSSYLLQVDGVRILVDPVFIKVRLCLFIIRLLKGQMYINRKIFPILIT